MEASSCNLEYTGAKNIGWHQVRGELDACELRLHHVRQRLRHQRFCRSRYTFQKDMSTREKRDREKLEWVLHANQNLIRFRTQSFKNILEIRWVHEFSSV